MIPNYQCITSTFKERHYTHLLRTMPRLLRLKIIFNNEVRSCNSSAKTLSQLLHRMRVISEVFFHQPSRSVSFFLLAFLYCSNHFFLFYSATPATNYDRYVLALGLLSGRFSLSEKNLHIHLNPGLTSDTYRIYLPFTH